MPSLLQKARGSNLSIQEQAMAVLRDLAFAPEHRVAIANGGGIPVFVDILSARENATACLYAASCLRSLALGNEWAEMVLFAFHSGSSQRWLRFCVAKQRVRQPGRVTWTMRTRLHRTRKDGEVVLA